MVLAEPGHWKGAFEAYTHVCVQSSSPFSVCHHGNMLQPQAPITMDAAAMTESAAMTDITDRKSREVGFEDWFLVGDQRINLTLCPWNFPHTR